MLLHKLNTWKKKNPWKTIKPYLIIQLFQAIHLNFQLLTVLHFGFQVFLQCITAYFCNAAQRPVLPVLHFSFQAWIHTAFSDISDKGIFSKQVKTFGVMKDSFMFLQQSLPVCAIYHRANLTVGFLEPAW